MLRLVLIKAEIQTQHKIELQMLPDTAGCTAMTFEVFLFYTNNHTSYSNFPFAEKLHPPLTPVRGVCFSFHSKICISYMSRSLEICFQDILGNSINSLNCLSNKYPQQQQDCTFLERKANSLKEPMYVKDFCAAPSTSDTGYS